MSIAHKILLIIILQFLVVSPAWSGTDVKDSVVKIYTANARHNYQEPWQMHGQGSYQGSGAIIGSNKILTNAHVVSDHTFIQVRRAGRAKKFTAQLEVISHESDLAILSVDDASFFSGVQPLAIGELPNVKDRVAVYGFPEGGDKLSLTEGVVSRIEHTSYTHSGAYMLTCQIDAPINAGNSGGPVIKDGKIAGVAFQGLSNERFDNIGYMVPAPVITHFINDITDGTYDGTPDLGISMQKMESPDSRKNYFMLAGQTGVLVNKVYPNSPALGVLRRGDIILSIDGQSIANDGTIEFRKGERTFFSYVTQKKQINDTVGLEILRDKARRTVDITLTRAIDYERLVPQRQYDKAPTYYIAGGLVFEPLTLNYLIESGGGGSEWYLSAPTALLNYYINGEPAADRREVVVLVKVLADEINIGYHDSQNVIVSHVNGKKVSGMKDLVDAFEKHGGKYHVIEDIRGYMIILSKTSVDEHSLRILKRYKIGADRSADL